MVRGRPKFRKWPARHKVPLDELIAHLRHAQSAAIVAVAALRRQNCELDADVARLLQRCVCDSLGEQLENLEAAGGAVPLAVRAVGPPGPRIHARALAGARTR